jgi:AcrR family transcriptional regulator
MGSSKKSRKIKGKKLRQPVREPLSRDRIEFAALLVIEEEGLEGFSTRKLGERLGCEAMSIYHHFPSKAHLLNALVDRLVVTIPLPPKELDPVERIRRIGYAYRKIGHDHPRFFPYVALHRMNSRVTLEFLNEVIGMFRDAGLDPESMARLFRAFSYYLTGAVLDETSGYAKGPSAVDPVSDEDLVRLFPHVAAAGPYFKPSLLGRTFDIGLEIMLSAVTATARHGQTENGGKK